MTFHETISFVCFIQLLKYSIVVKLYVQTSTSRSTPNVFWFFLFLAIFKMRFFGSGGVYDLASQGGFPFDGRYISSSTGC